ncbi:MAG: hypothetical protein QX197_16570 [Methylococcaceae bacterium]
MSINTISTAIVTAAQVSSAISTNKLSVNTPVVTNSTGEVILQLSIPEHIGFTAEDQGNSGRHITLRERLMMASEPSIDHLTAFNTVVQQGIDKYVPTVVDEDQVTVRTIVFNQDNTTVSSEPIVVKGTTGTGEADATHPLRQEAVVIDAHTLAAGTVIQLDNVEFAIVIGDVKVIGGAGSHFIMGDDSGQVFSTGNQNDVLIGGSGDDRLDAGAGHNLVDGGVGNDTLMLHTTGELRVYLTHNASNTVNPYEQVVVNMTTGEQTIYRNIENANINGTAYDIGFLTLPGSQLETLGVLSQLVFDKAPGAEFISQWGALAGDTSTLASALLATGAVKAQVDALSDAQFSSMMVQNGLGSHDAGAIQFVTTYLQSHSRAELIDLALKAPVVIDHAYSTGGLAIIANDHSTVALMTEAELLKPVNKVILPITTNPVVNQIHKDTGVINRIVVPIVTTARLEDTTTKHKTLADIPVIQQGSEVILQVSVPVSVGFTAEEIVSGQGGRSLSLRELLMTTTDPRVEPLSVFNDIVKQGIDAYVATVTDQSQVAVRTITFNQNITTPTNEAIVIQGALGKGEGDATHANRQEAVIIDAHTLAAGTTIQLNNIEFAIVIGDVKVVTGKGNHFIIADDNTQVLSASGGNDTLISSLGDDRLSAGAGNNTVDGGAGVDTIVYDYDTTAPVHVYLTHNSTDTEHPFDTVVVNSLAEHTTFRNLETADVNGNKVAISALQQPANQLEKIGVLSQLFLDKAPGLDLIASLEPVANNTSALINAFLATDTVKAQLGALSNHDLAVLLVHNGLGNADASAIQFSDDYLQTHSLADLVLVGVNYASVVEHAYGTEGLMLI